MVLTRAQAKRLEETRTIRGVVLGYLLDGITPVKIHVETLVKNTHQFNYNGGHFYTARDFSVLSIEPARPDCRGKKMRYSIGQTTLGQILEQGANSHTTPLLFFDRL